MRETNDELQAGKYIIWHRTLKDEQGNPKEFVRWAPDAKEMLRTGEYVEDPKDAGKSKTELRRAAIERLLVAEGMEDIGDDDQRGPEELVVELKRLRAKNKALADELDGANRLAAVSEHEDEVVTGDPLATKVGFGKHAEKTWAELAAVNPAYARRHGIEKGRVPADVLGPLEAILVVESAKVAPTRERKPRNAKG